MTTPHETAEAFIARKQAERLPRRTMLGDGEWHIQAATYRPQRAFPAIFTIERMQQTNTGGVEYRFCYYQLDKAGKWGWGRYCPLIPTDELLPLLQQAVREGTIRAEDLPLAPEAMAR